VVAVDDDGRMRLALPVLVLSTALVAGCSAPTTAPTTAPDGAGSATTQTETAPAPSAAGEALLAKHALRGKSAMEVIDTLDRMPMDQRPTDLMASVRPDRLLVSGDDTEVTLPIPPDRFYLSVAPYVDSTHECFNHSLTTCKGELGGEDVEVSLVDESTGAVLADGVKTVFANGFIGFWLPKDTTATLRIGHEGKVAQTKVSTHADDPTCLTTMQLA